MAYICMIHEAFLGHFQLTMSPCRSVFLLFNWGSLYAKLNSQGLEFQEKEKQYEKQMGKLIRKIPKIKDAY